MIRLVVPPAAAENFIRAAARWQETFKKDVAVVLRQQARSIITNSQRTGVVDLTPPTAGQGSVGSASEQREAGETAVAKDIRSIFMTAKAAIKIVKDGDPKAGRLFARMLRQKKAAEAIALIRQSGQVQDVAVKAHTRKGGAQVRSYQQKRTVPLFRELSRITEIQGQPDPSIHRRQRNSRGRVRQAYPSVIILPEAGAGLVRYIEKKQAMVGYHKSGWRASAAAVGVGLPAFVARHSAPGRVIDNLNRTGTSFGITFINDAPSIARQNRDMGIAARALQFAADRIDRAIQGFRRRTQRI